MSTPASGPGFDRVRKRHLDDRTSPVGHDQQADHEGKRALFSDVAQAPTPGSVAVTCRRCDTRSVVSLPRLARLSLPGVHLPLPGRRGLSWRAWVVCPECHARSWVSISVR